MEPPPVSGRATPSNHYWILGDRSYPVKKNPLLCVKICVISKRRHLAGCGAARYLSQRLARRKRGRFDSILLNAA
jgi:hypothetical protein